MVNSHLHYHCATSEHLNFFLQPFLFCEPTVNGLNCWRQSAILIRCLQQIFLLLLGLSSVHVLANVVWTFLHVLHIRQVIWFIEPPVDHRQLTAQLTR